MVNLNVDWGNPNVAGYVRHPKPTHAEGKSFLGGLFTLNGGEQEQKLHGRSHSSSSRPTPRRADTVTVLPAGVKMPEGDQPQISYGADGAKYLVIPPRRSNSSSRPRQIIVTHSPSPRRQNSTTSSARVETRSPPHRSNSSSQQPKSAPKTKLVGDPELVKQYEHSQRNVARWVEAVADSGSTQSRTSKRTMTR
ncbi:hypothetical protein RhiJN_15772 [Ceratobasidium sp. AG-Ba]|nr:hypothetical protein RhiJN_15772 [Ceratobasidium sp. AG-Ba]